MKCSTEAVVVMEHMSDGPVGELHDVQQYAHRRKPDGLWLSMPGKTSWAWFNEIRSEDSRSEHWFGIMEFHRTRIDVFPWSNVGLEKIVCLDLSDRSQIDAFIARYQMVGTTNCVDWCKVAREFGGVWFVGTDRIDTKTRREFDQSDGCWVISIDVDSACLWARQAMNVLQSI